MRKTVKAKPSATLRKRKPLREAKPHRQIRYPANAGSGARTELDRLERWVQEVITHPQGSGAGADSPSATALIDVNSESIEKVILPSKQLTSIERMDIYASAYFLRLVECLEKDFEAVANVVGHDRFDEIARAYLVAHPSTHYSLNFLGAKFAEYLRKDVEELPDRDFLYDLANLEWSVQVVFDERHAEPIKSDALLDVPVKKWPVAKLRIIPAFQLHAFKYPVNTFLQAVYDGKAARVPTTRQSWVMVYRHGYKTFRAALDKDRYALLAAIASGKPLGEALEACADQPDVNLERLATSCKSWFKEWASEGLFYAIDL